MTRGIDDFFNCYTLQICGKYHNRQLSIEDFHVPIGSTLDPDNRWVIFSSLMPWEELKET
jgi:hypothetical protein